MPARKQEPSVEQAQILAIQALKFVAEDESRLDRFFQLTGLTPETLRAEAGDPAMLSAFLEHLMSDETLLLTFCSNNGTDPALVASAHRALERDQWQP